MQQTRFTGVMGVACAGLLLAGCYDATDSVRPFSGAPQFAAVPGPPVLDQANGTMGFAGTDIRKGFNPYNPQTGDAVVATFIWKGTTTNVITSVIDHLTDGTPVGNTYNLIEYRNAGGLSMATYVALNVQNFPDGNPSDPAPNQDKILVVTGTLSQPITHGGIMISAYRGVATVAALSASASAGGTSSTTTPASTGPITPGDGALIYSASASMPNAGVDPPAGFSEVNYLSTDSAKLLGQWKVHSGSGTTDPTWNWFFTQPTDWAVTNIALLPNGGVGPTTGSLTATTSTSGSGLDPDGYTVTVDGGASQAIGINGSVTFDNLTAGSHSVEITGVAANCSVSGPNPRTVSVPAGGTANTAFSVTCTAPNTPPGVNAGPDQTVLTSLLFSLNWSFTDPDNGPWSYTIDWGDGTFSTGTKTAPGSFSNGHNYGPLLRTYTIRITVTDGQGASHSDTANVTVVLF
jgi:hypothetical protein